MAEQETHKLTPKKKTHVRTSVRRRGYHLNREQTEEAQDKFLKAYASTANIRAACMSALVTMTLAFFVMACAVGYAPKHGETLSFQNTTQESEPNS